MAILVSRSIGEYSAPRQLAYNEICLNSIEAGNPILRVFTFSEAGAIIAYNESLWDVREPFRSFATRRHTGGSVIYVDENTLGYTLLFHKRDLETNYVSSVYRKLTEPIAAGLKAFGLRAEIGRLFSLRVEGKVIAGHAQYNKNNRIQYDGIIHLRPPDAEKIGKAIKLRTLSLNKRSHVVCIDNCVYDISGSLLGREGDFDLKPIRNEAEDIAEMPGLSDFGLGLEDYVNILITSFERTFGMDKRGWEIPKKMEEEAQNLEKSKYRNSEWVGGGSKRCLGHCFVDMVEPENSN